MSTASSMRPGVHWARRAGAARIVLGAGLVGLGLLTGWLVPSRDTLLGVVAVCVASLNGYWKAFSP